MRVCHKYMTHPLSIIYPSFSDEDQSHVFIAYSIHIVGWRHLPLSLLFPNYPKHCLMSNGYHSFHFPHLQIPHPSLVVFGH